MSHIVLIGPRPPTLYKNFLFRLWIPGRMDGKEKINDREKNSLR